MTPILVLRSTTALSTQTTNIVIPTDRSQTISTITLTKTPTRLLDLDGQCGGFHGADIGAALALNHDNRSRSLDFRRQSDRLRTQRSDRNILEIRTGDWLPAMDKRTRGEKGCDQGDGY